MTCHGVNLVLSIGACELAPGAPHLQGARPLGNRGMSLVGHLADPGVSANVRFAPPEAVIRALANFYCVGVGTYSQKTRADYQPSH